MTLIRLYSLLRMVFISRVAAQICVAVARWTLLLFSFILLLFYFILQALRKRTVTGVISLSITRVTPSLLALRQYERITIQEVSQ